MLRRLARTELHADLRVGIVPLTPRSSRGRMGGRPRRQEVREEGGEEEGEDPPRSGDGEEVVHAAKVSGPPPGICSPLPPY